MRNLANATTALLAAYKLAAAADLPAPPASEANRSQWTPPSAAALGLQDGAAGYRNYTNAAGRYFLAVNSLPKGIRPVDRNASETIARFNDVVASATTGKAEALDMATDRLLALTAEDTRIRANIDNGLGAEIERSLAVHTLLPGTQAEKNAALRVQHVLTEGPPEELDVAVAQFQDAKKNSFKSFFSVLLGVIGGSFFVAAAHSLYKAKEFVKSTLQSIEECRALNPGNDIELDYYKGAVAAVADKGLAERFLTCCAVLRRLEFGLHISDGDRLSYREENLKGVVSFSTMGAVIGACAVALVASTSLVGLAMSGALSAGAIYLLGRMNAKIWKYGISLEKGASGAVQRQLLEKRRLQMAGPDQ